MNIKEQEMDLLLGALSGIDTNTIIGNIEQNGRDKILKKVQLPIYANTINGKYLNIKDTKEEVAKKYWEIGIKIINEENDLFYNVELPENIKLKSSDNVYWTYLIDEKNNDYELASIFYKAVFYDRDAFININW